MAQCIIFLWTITWSQYPNLWGQCSPSHHPFDSGGPANAGITLSLIPLLSIGGPANMGVTIQWAKKLFECLLLFKDS